MSTRKHIFRAKTVSDGKWVYGYLNEAISPMKSEDGIVSKLRIGRIFIIEDTIGEFTGLTDKDGREIYEGDLVKWGHTDNCHENPPRIAIVEYSPDICFRAITPTEHAYGETGYVFQFGCFSYQETDKYLEVVGNIHDNPELLKGGDK